MSILRKQLHDRHFTIIENNAIRDSRLSFKATGILCYLLSKPDGWTVNHRELMNNKTDGRASVLSGLTELEDCGYLERFKERQPDGTFVNISLLREVPRIVPDGTMDSTQTPSVEDPSADNPSADNRDSIRRNEHEVPRKKETKEEVTNSSALAVNGKTPVKKEGKSSPYMKEAREVARTFYEERQAATGRAPANYLGLQNNVVRLFEAGWSREEIEWTLRNTMAFTLNAMEFTLNSRTASREEAILSVVEDYARRSGVTVKDFETSDW